MMDFLKSYPFLKVEDYYWNYSHIMIQLMIRDATKVVYLSEKQAKQYKQMKSSGAKADGTTEDPNAFAAALGIPTFD